MREVYELPYAEMCEASHSCHGTLEYTLVGLDSEPKVHFGPMAPSTRPITLTFVAMLSDVEMTAQPQNA